MSSATRAMLVVAVLGAATLLHTWPLATHVGTHMQAGSDPKTMMWSQHDLALNLVQDPLHLMDGSAFAPYDKTLAVVDHQLGNAILAAPLVLAGFSTVTVFNVVFLATFFLSGLFTYALVRRLTGSTAAGLAAGCAFAFSAARVYNLPHSHVLATQWLPLALLALDRFLERPTAKRWIALLIAAMLVAFSSWHLAVIGSLGIGVVALFTLAAGPVSRARLIGLAAVGGLCALALLPLAQVYMDVAGRWPAVREGELPPLTNVIKNSVDLAEGLFDVPKESRSPFSGWMASNGPSIFPGIVALLLAVSAGLGLRRTAGAAAPRVLRWFLWGTAGLFLATLAASLAGPAAATFLRAGRALSPLAALAVALTATGLWAARTRRDGLAAPRYTIIYLALAVAGVFLALGPRVTAWGVDLGSGLWRLDLLGLPLLMRAPVRFSLLVGLGLAVLCGLMVAELERRLPGRRGLAVMALMVLLINADLMFEMPELAAVPAPSDVDRWLAENPEDGTVLEYPLHGNYWSIYASQEFYGRRSVDGRGFLRPPAVRRIRARPDLSAQQVDILWEDLHPRYIVVRGGLYKRPERRRVAAAIEALGPALELRARDGEDAVYEMFDHGGSPTLLRRWPSSRLRKSLGLLSLEAALSRTDSGVAGRLLVLLNGEVLREISESDLERRPNQVVRFDMSQVVDGINTFELRVLPLADEGSRRRVLLREFRLQ